MLKKSHARTGKPGHRIQRLIEILQAQPRCLQFFHAPPDHAEIISDACGMDQCPLQNLPADMTRSDIIRIILHLP